MLSLTYVSSASELLGDAELSGMLVDWRVKNHARGLTGMLLYSGGNIIQVLEGPEEMVDATFGTISADPRHRGVLPLLREPITDRAFPDWSMGFRSLGVEEVQRADGFNPFLQQPSGSDEDAHADSAHRLLLSFKQNMR